VLTRHGWTAVAACLAAFAIGRVFGLLELFIVGAGLAVAIVVAVVVVRRPLPDLHVQRAVRPSTVAVGEPARVDIRVVNVDRRRTPHLQLWEPVGDNGGAPMQLAVLGPGESASAAYRVPTARRGLLVAGPLRAARRDVLGLAARSFVLAGSDDVLIVPQHVHLPFPDAGSAGRLGQHLRMKAWGQTGGEFHSLREYVPGDDLRRINWKASARSEDLVVRETALEGVRRCTVVLDTNSAEYDPESFERAVSAAASVTIGAVAANIATRLVAPGIDLRGPDVAVNGLRWLATVATTVEPFDAAVLGRGPSEGIGLVVVVTGTAGSPTVGAARGRLSPDEALVTIATAHGDGAAGGMVVGATSLQALLDGWTALVVGHRTKVPA
jgi:uncharacterized protein (DUF58 family)